MILPKALALSVQIIMLVATVDRVPQLDAGVQGNCRTGRCDFP
jgi:hypothetical protein